MLGIIIILSVLFRFPKKQFVHGKAQCCKVFYGNRSIVSRGSYNYISQIIFSDTTCKAVVGTVFSHLRYIIICFYKMQLKIQVAKCYNHEAFVHFNLA